MNNLQLREALDRTLLLMRDELVDAVTDEVLLDALTATSIVIIGDEQNLACHAGQCAYVAAATLMARSGHRVHLVAPSVVLTGAQPPLKKGELIPALIELGRDLLPDIEFRTGPPDRMADLAITIGDSPITCTASRAISLNASRWTAIIRPVRACGRWREQDWPFGALAAGALASGEAFKEAMKKLRRFANDSHRFDRFFRFCDTLDFRIAPPDSPAPKALALGKFDFVSGGAITNSALFCLARIPGVHGAARVIEPDTADLTNINRYALLRSSHRGHAKAETLGGLDLGALNVTGLPLRYDPSTAAAFGALAANVLVGVDHIPTRWEVQSAAPEWLAIGATTHWSAMASFHEKGLACARCLHSRDDPLQGRIPTVSFVSFLSGLLVASYFVRHKGGDVLSTHEQCTYFTPLRPEEMWRSPVAISDNCPACRSGEAARRK